MESESEHPSWTAGLKLEHDKLFMFQGKKVQYHLILYAPAY